MTSTSTRLLCFVLASLPPGRYAGVCEQGRVDLELEALGRATYGGVEYDWSLDGTKLSLRPRAAGETLALTVETSESGPVLVGPPFGRVWLRAAPWPTSKFAEAPLKQSAAPSPLRGSWRHTASGGTVELRLSDDGTYRLQQAENLTEGRWSYLAGRLSLLTPGNPPLHYMVELSGGRLALSGGDLPITVWFVPVKTL